MSLWKKLFSSKQVALDVTDPKIRSVIIPVSEMLADKPPSVAIKYLTDHGFSRGEANDIVDSVASATRATLKRRGLPTNHLD